MIVRIPELLLSRSSWSFLKAMGKRGFLGDEEDNDISAADAAIVDVMAAASPDSAADDFEAEEEGVYSITT